MNSTANENKWRGRLIRYAPVLLWIGVIFYLSSGAGAMSETSRFIRPILQFLFPDAAEEMLQLYHGAIRKFAHFAEYAVLAFLASRALLGSHFSLLRKYWHALTLLLVLIVAGMDEYGQSLDPARTGSVYDVMIDAAGGIFAVIATALFIKFRRRSHEPG